MDTAQKSQTELAYDLLAVLPGVALAPPEPPKLSALIRNGASTGPQITGHLVQYMLRMPDATTPIVGFSYEIGSCAIGGAWIAAVGGSPPSIAPGGIPLITQSQIEADFLRVLGYDPYDTKVPAVYCRDDARNIRDGMNKEEVLAASRESLEKECNFPKYAASLGSVIETLNDAYDFTRDEIATVVEHLGY